MHKAKKIKLDNTNKSVEKQYIINVNLYNINDTVHENYINKSNDNITESIPFYILSKKHINDNLVYMHRANDKKYDKYYIYEVEPDNHIVSNKYGSVKIVKRYDMYTYDTITEFDFTINSDFVFMYLMCNRDDTIMIDKFIKDYKKAYDEFLNGYNKINSSDVIRIYENEFFILKELIKTKNPSLLDIFKNIEYVYNIYVIKTRLYNILADANIITLSTITKLITRLDQSTNINIQYNKHIKSIKEDYVKRCHDDASKRINKNTTLYIPIETDHISVYDDYINKTIHNNIDYFYVNFIEDTKYKYDNKLLVECQIPYNAELFTVFNNINGEKLGYMTNSITVRKIYNIYCEETKNLLKLENNDSYMRIYNYMINDQK